MKLKSKKKIHYKGKVNDLTVKNSHTYNVEGLSVHNSGAGSLASYLLGITEVDPIPFNLMFERFYNAGRNTATHVSMPDIDVDFPASSKDSVIEYITNKYGKYNTAKICTWGTLQAKAVISDVLRMYGIDFTTIKNISKLLPNKLDIEESMKEQEESSVLNWTIKNEPKILSEWVKTDDSGKLLGDFASYFEQAIRLEGTIKSLGQHAAGVVITSEPINEICPMIKSKEGTIVTGYEMHAAEAIGCDKFDILTVEALDVLQEYNRIVESL